jgi:hypothetical protein
MTTRTLLLSLHIMGVAGWLGANFMQLALSPRFFKGHREGAIAWARQSVWLSDRYYALPGLTVIVTGFLLVFHEHWPWSSGFIWVGIGSIVAIAVTIGPFIGPSAKQRLAALEAGDMVAAKKAQRTKTVVDVVDTCFVLLALLAMVDKWKA